jgi:hypothetical protein
MGGSETHTDSRIATIQNPPKQLSSGPVQGVHFSDDYAIRLRTFEQIEAYSMNVNFLDL